MKGSVESSKSCIQQLIPKRKGHFMKSCSFSDSEVELLYDIPPNQERYFDYVQKDLAEKSTLCGPRYAQHEVNCINSSIKLGNFT